MNEWRDPRFKPGLWKIDKWYGFFLIVSVVLWYVTCKSITDHWTNVGIAAATILVNICFFALLHASKLSKQEFISTTWRFIRQEEKQRSKREGEKQ